MSAILFGSMSTIADTSELQRMAFNDAFAAHNLDWVWDRDTYVGLLSSSGGAQRIADYAAERVANVDAAAVHKTKSELFQARLVSAVIAPRPGVAETMQAAKSAGLQVALVTTTSPENVAALTQATRNSLQWADFSLIVDATSVDEPKPDAAAYTFALAQLGEQQDTCIAIEDNVGGVHSAVAAGLPCVAFPNENTVGHDFGEASGVVSSIELAELRQMIGA